MGLIIGQCTKSGGGGGGASAADKALVQNATQYGLSHNLYKVMEEVKKDPRTQGYEAIMLCQYYKGYNSLSLEGGADAFLTSDGDFYQGNAVHDWHDSNDEHFDRWVAMLFSSQSGSYSCSNADLCPRAALIDGTMGNINISGNYMRFSWIDVTDGSSWGAWKPTANHISNWNRQTIIRGMRAMANTYNTMLNLSGAASAVVGVRSIGNYSITESTNATTHLSFPDLTTITGNGCLLYFDGASGVTGMQEIDAPLLTTASKLIGLPTASRPTATNLRYLMLPSLVSATRCFATSSADGNSAIGWASLIHFEIGQGYYGNLNLKPCSFANCLKTDANDLVEDVVAHPTWSNLDQWLYNFEHLIVDKLADLSGQTAKTITLAAAPYAAIAESIRQKMASKNWNLASA